MILAGITLYNPDLPVLKKNIETLIDQVDALVLVDNGSKEVSSWESEVLGEFPQVHLIKNDGNKGIAVALNQIYTYAKEIGCEWVLTVDQDSCCPKDIIASYWKYTDIDRVGAICPVVCDRNYQNRDKIQGEYTLVDKCITSAAFTSVKVWEEVGGFLEALFIDFVDHDFSAKLVEHGYKIIRANTVCLEHEIGKGRTYHFLWRRVTTFNHPPFRKYYQVRNWVYYIKAHKRVICVPCEWCRFAFFFVKTFLYEKNRKEKFREMRRGMKDAKEFCRQNIRA